MTTLAVRYKSDMKTSHDHIEHETKQIVWGAQTRRKIEVDKEMTFV
jgi:hypothetical protein